MQNAEGLKIVSQVAQRNRPPYVRVGSLVLMALWVPLLTYSMSTFTAAL